MEYGYLNNKTNDYDRQTIINKTNCSSESPTSSSVSSSSNLSLKNQLMSTPFKSGYDEGTMTSSTSQIFATAASLHVDQNETVRYTRETMHLLAKFLAENSNNQIFGPIYAFAPDNLAWLWAFFDWDEPLDLSKIPNQEIYEPLTIPSIDDKNLQAINNYFTDAPLIQYKYREKIMIGDVCKFIEYIHSIKVPELAKALFLLYFPRFNNYIENTLGAFLAPKLLTSNIHLIKKVDEMIISLIKTRYTNVEEYKEKIIGGNGLPTYISNLLKENNFWSQNSTDLQDVYLDLNFQNNEALNSTHNNAEKNEIIDDMIFNDLLMSLNFNKKNHIEAVNNDTNINDELMDIFGNFDGINQSNLIPSEKALSLKKTIDYMNEVNKNARINDDLDHVSFDDKCFFNNINLDNKESENINEISSFEEKSNMNEFENSEVIASPYACFNPDSKFFSLAYKKKKELSSVGDYLDSSNSEYNSNTCTPVKSEHFIQHSSSSPQKLLQECTPPSPSNLKNYFQEKQKVSLWSSDALINRSNRKPSLLLAQYGSDSIQYTPPSSVKQKSTPMTISSTVCNNNSGLALECIGSPKYVKNTDESSFHHYVPKFNDQLGINASIGANEQYNSLFKNTFYGSPVSRLTLSNNKTTNQNQHVPYQPFSNLKQQHHRLFSSNSELPSTSGSLPKQTFLFADNNNTDNNNNHKSNSNNNFKVNNNIYNLNKSQQKHTWSGRLPPKTYYKNASYSRKVFLGGLPWDVNHNHLQQLLQRYGSVKLEIPGKDSKHPRVSANAKMPERSPGYVYIIFDKEESVENLLSECRLNVQMHAQHFYFALSQANNSFNNKRGNDCAKIKEVEVIPWNQEDTSYVPINKTSMALPSKIDAKSTIFVGALHGMLNAQGLGQVMTELFGEVIHASLDTDKYKYPIGSGRVTFRNKTSYVKAIKAKFVSIKVNPGINDPTPKFEKTIQIDPYLEEARCSKCSSRSVYFCRSEHCLEYFCELCWQSNHDMSNGEHQSMTRMQNSKNNYN